MEGATETNKILWSKLPDKEIKLLSYQLRVLQFDPSNAINVFSPRPFQRSQNIGVGQLFPNIDGLCACGCGKEIKKPRRRWATDECSFYTVAVRNIIAGASSTISFYLSKYYGWKCFNCGCKDKGHDMGANGVVAWIKVDHIIPVKLGGGACWLSNYQLLCHDCHVNKTNKDFNWKQ